MYHMPTPHKVASLAAILSNYVTMLALSCFFYVLVLRKRGRLGINAVADSPVDDDSRHKESQTDLEPRFWTGNPETVRPAQVSTDVTCTDVNIRKTNTCDKECVVTV
jgi:hypothetical protein